MDRKSKINQKILLKRQNRDLKKTKFLSKKIETKSIAIQTDEIKKEPIKLETEIIEHEIKQERYENIYKGLYYGLLVECDCLSINDECEYKKRHLNKIFDKVDINLGREKEIFFMDDKNIILKMSIDNKNIKINYYKEKIEKNIEKKFNTKITLIKKNSNILKINDNTELIFKNKLNYYYIK